MRLLDRLTGSQRWQSGSFSTSNGVPILPTNVWGWSYGSPDKEQILPTFTSYVAGGYQANGVVFAVVLARLMLFSEATFKFQNLSTKDLFGNTDLELLEFPWPNGTTGELLARMEQDVSLSGNAFIRNAGDQLERLRPDYVTIVSRMAEDGLGRQVRKVVGYYYDESTDDPARRAELYDVSEVAHWSPIPDPLADFRGMSWLTPIVREINADSGLTAYKTKYLDNAATPNMLVKYAQELAPEAVEKVKAMVTAKHGGVANAFGTMVLDRGADATIMGNNLKEMDFSTVQAAGETRIAAAAGVPGIVVGLKEGLQAATYSNYEQAMRRFADLTMRPLWRSACAALAPLVNVPSGSRLWFDTTDIAALRQGEKERAETLQVKAIVADMLVRAGYEPDTVVPAITADDLSKLKHTGRIPISLYDEDHPTDASFPKTNKATGDPAAAAGTPADTALAAKPPAGGTP